MGTTNKFHPEQDQSGRCNERGAIMVETALSFTVLLFMVLSTFELLRLGYTGLATQYLLSKFSRVAVVGGAQSSTERAAEIRADLIAFGQKLGVELDPANNPDAVITICPDTGYCTNGLDVGTSSGYFTIRISDSFKMLFNTVRIPYENVILARNEPF